MNARNMATDLEIDSWFLQTVARRDDPAGEAHTSHHVVEVLKRCFGWPHDRILPQKSGGTRGPIDYVLVAHIGEIHVEVKSRVVDLDDGMIRKYLVHRGRGERPFAVGVLTNLEEWKIYVAGSQVRELTGAPMQMVKSVVVETVSDIHRLRTFLGFEQNSRSRKLTLTMRDGVKRSLSWGQ